MFEDETDRGREECDREGFSNRAGVHGLSLQKRSHGVRRPRWTGPCKGRREWGGETVVLDNAGRTFTTVTTARPD